MAYSYQTFTNSQVFTSAQAQQIEVNIRDHVHGANGVTGAGLTWIYDSKTAAFTIAASDAGKLFNVAGDFDVSFISAVTLGQNWACTFKNTGSGRVAIKPFGSQTIDGSSLYALTPNEGINVWSDGANLNTFGHTNGAFKLFEEYYPGSRGNVDIKKIWPGDFKYYELYISDCLKSANDRIWLRVSVDSASTFEATLYDNIAGGGGSTASALTGNCQSNQAFYVKTTFTSPNSTHGQTFWSEFIRKSTGTTLAADAQAILSAWMVSSVAINALRVLPESGRFDSIRVSLWGFR